MHAACLLIIDLVICIGIFSWIMSGSFIRDKIESDIECGGLLDCFRKKGDSLLHVRQECCQSGIRCDIFLNQFDCGVIFNQSLYNRRHDATAISVSMNIFKLLSDRL